MIHSEQHINLPIDLLYHRGRFYGFRLNLGSDKSKEFWFWKSCDYSEFSDLVGKVVCEYVDNVVHHNNIVKMEKKMKKENFGLLQTVLVIESTYGAETDCSIVKDHQGRALFAGKYEDALDFMRTHQASLRAEYEEKFLSSEK